MISLTPVLHLLVSLYHHFCYIRWSGGQPSNLPSTTATTVGSKDSVASVGSNAGSTALSAGASTATTSSTTNSGVAIGAGSGVSGAANHPHTATTQGLTTSSTTSVGGATTSKNNTRSAAATITHRYLHLTPFLVSFPVCQALVHSELISTTY